MQTGLVRASRVWSRASGPTKTASACSAQFTDVELKPTLSNSFQHFVYISGLSRNYALKLWRNDFGILPTGFAKSLIFHFCCHVNWKTYGNENVLVS